MIVEDVAGDLADELVRDYIPVDLAESFRTELSVMLGLHTLVIRTVSFVLEVLEGTRTVPGLQSLFIAGEGDCLDSDFVDAQDLWLNRCDPDVDWGEERAEWLGGEDGSDLPVRLVEFLWDELIGSDFVDSLDVHDDLGAEVKQTAVVDVVSTVLGLVQGSVVLPSLPQGLYVGAGFDPSGVVLSVSWRVAAEARRH